MPNSPVHSLRIDPTLKGQLDRARGQDNLSAWLLEAATQRLQAERGLGPEITETLVQRTAQLRGLGTNLNQLAHAANEGRPVSLDRRLAQDINAAINEVRVAVERDQNSLTMKERSIDEDFVFILPQMRSAKGPLSGDRRRSLILQAIHGNPHGNPSGKGRGAPQVMLKITSFSSSAQKLAAHLDYISRNGDNEVFDRYGNRFSHLSEASENAHPREAIQLYGSEIATASETPHRKKGGPRSRVSMNMMLSMPPGTDKTAFELAVGDFINEEYAAFDYVYAFHDDRAHYHAHVVVGLLGSDGRWLNPRKNDIAQWRQRFASSLQRRGIAAQATPSYSRGKPKAGYRRDIAELGERGTRRVPRPAPTYDAEKEKDAIEKRAQAWTRIAKHYREAGDVAAAEQISGFVADSFSGREAPDRATPSGRGGRGR